MPLEERCKCLGVVAPDEKITQNPQSELWFTDERKNLTKRSNWTPEVLNKLLERDEYCSEYAYA